MVADDEEVLPIKCVVVGPDRSGKTCAVITFRAGSFPDEYVPINYDDGPGGVGEYDGKPYRLCVWDVCGGVCGGFIKQFSYFNTSVLLLLFDVTNSKEMLETINSYWKAEFSAYCPDVPIILVGSKVDLRCKERILSITVDEGRTMAKKIRAVKYMEISSLQLRGVTELFDEVVRIGYNYHCSSITRKGRRCRIL